MLRVRIVASGDTFFGTKIIDADTGKELDGGRISEVRWSHRAGSLPRVDITFLGVEVDVVGRMETPEERALGFLKKVGREEHPHAATDPVGALGQVAVDLQQALNLLPRPAVPALPTPHAGDDH